MTHIKGNDSFQRAQNCLMAGVALDNDNGAHVCTFTYRVTISMFVNLDVWGFDYS